MADLASIEIVLATVSVVGFIIFFGSPTAIAIVSQMEASRYERKADTSTDAGAIRERAAAVMEEGAIGRYFAREFGRPSTVSFVFWVSVLFGAATLTDILSVAFTWQATTYGGYPLVNVSLTITFCLAFVAVSAALCGITILTLSAQRAYTRAKDEVLRDASVAK